MVIYLIFLLSKEDDSYYLLVLFLLYLLSFSRLGFISVKFLLMAPIHSLTFVYRVIIAFVFFLIDVFSCLTCP